MKKIIAFTMILAAVGLTSMAQVERKQDDTRKSQQMKGHRGQGKKMMQDLNLTEDQKAKLKAEREASKSQLDAIRNDASLSETQKKEKAKAIHDAQKAKMQSILTPAQKEQMEKNKKEAKEKGKEMAEKRKDMMDKRQDAIKDLNLSNDQAEKLKAHNQAVHEKMKAIKSNTSLSQEQKKAEMKNIQQWSKDERKKILTAEQLQKMEAMKKDRMKKGKGQMKRQKTFTSK
jgi:protein CpxP